MTSERKVVFLYVALAVTILAIIVLLVKKKTPESVTTTRRVWTEADSGMVVQKDIEITHLEAILEDEQRTRQADSTENKAVVAFYKRLIKQVEATRLDTSGSDSTTFTFPVARAMKDTTIVDRFVSSNGDTADVVQTFRFSAAYHFPPPMPGSFDLKLGRSNVKIEYRRMMIEEETEKIYVEDDVLKLVGAAAAGTVLGYGLAKDNQILIGAGAGGLVVVAITIIF